MNKKVYVANLPLNAAEADINTISLFLKLEV